MIGYIANHFSFNMIMNKDNFRRIFTRFLKDYGIYSFIIREIHKDYKNGFDGFFHEASKHSITDVFDLRSILSFPWEGYTYNEYERRTNFVFWKGINGIWKEFCRTNDYFKFI